MHIPFLFATVFVFMFFLMTDLVNISVLKLNAVIFAFILQIPYVP